MDNIEKFFDKIPIDKVYKDIFQPGMKKAGEALATVLDLSNCILLPIKLLNERSKVVFTENMKRYEKKLQNVDEKKITQVPEYVGIPILDKLTYLSEKHISEAFINLLASASNEDTLKLVHPSFLSTLGDLSSDEAKILFELKEKPEIAFIDIYVIREKEKIKKPSFMDSEGPKTREQLKEINEYTFQDRQHVELKMAFNLTGIADEVKLDFPENIDLYLDNLEKQKIIVYDRVLYKHELIPEFENLENVIHKNTIDTVKSGIKKQTESVNNEFILTLDVRRGMIMYTDYGKCFIKACMNEIKNEVD